MVFCLCLILEQAAEFEHSATHVVGTTDEKGVLKTFTLKVMLALIHDKV